MIAIHFAAAYLAQPQSAATFALLQFNAYSICLMIGKIAVHHSSKWLMVPVLKQKALR
jgi:hypothetical protein